MSDWTAGYVADIDYTYGYYPELNPQRARIPLLYKGLVCPQFQTACELGFGQGVSINYHAAAGSTRWYGTDFNPAQTAFAQSLDQASRTGTLLVDDSFAAFASRDDLPDFDFIGLHGIWSWISDENRRVLVDFISRKLKVGGLLYISYNTMPGWAAFAPLRHLMHDHSEVMGVEGDGIVSRIDGAIDFADKLLATNPVYARANPAVLERVKLLKDQNRHYLAHEFFNRDWHPMPFATMAEWLAPAKLQFACSAFPLDHVDVLNLSKEQQDFLAELPDAMFRESVRDFMINQQFRRDYWIKGTQKLSPLRQHELLRKERIILVSQREGLSLKVQGALGEMELKSDIYAPLLDLLADRMPLSLDEILTALAPKGIQFPQILQAVMILIGQGHVMACQPEEEMRDSLARCAELNQHVCTLARSQGDVGHLVSALTGGGIGVKRFNQLFILAIQQGKRTSDEWAAFAHHYLTLQNQKILKDGKTLETAEENLAELQLNAANFEREVLPMLKSLRIV